MVQFIALCNLDATTKSYQIYVLLNFFSTQVETAAGSAPLLSLLAPMGCASQSSYWKAPPSTSSVEFAIVLGNLSDVCGVVLLVSPCGYSMADAPSVSILIPHQFVFNEYRQTLSYMLI